MRFRISVFQYLQNLFKSNLLVTLLTQRASHAIQTIDELITVLSDGSTVLTVVSESTATLARFPEEKERNNKRLQAALKGGGISEVSKRLAAAISRNPVEVIPNLRTILERVQCSNLYRARESMPS